MLINTDLSADTAFASRQNPLAAGGASASQTTSAATTDSAASQLDPSLQRLAGVQDTGREIQDEHEAGQVLESLRQGILGQPGVSLAAQANQLSQNVLSLLQPAD
jgi:flagellin-like hook-associated protein FlgL